MTTGEGRGGDAVRIMVVDDNPAVVDIASEYLEHSDSRFVVETETSAREAIERLEQSETGVDCIVSDYKMPEINGLEFLAAVRETCTDVPFILFTSKYQELFEREYPDDVTDLVKKDGSAGLYDKLAERVSRAAMSEAS